MANISAISYEFGCVRGQNAKTQTKLNLSKVSEKLVELPFGVIERMSYDWFSGLLYFVDAIRARIEVIKPVCPQ